MARRHARYSGDPTPSSGLIILYYPNRGLGVPSNFYRGPRGPSFSMTGFPPFFTGVPGDPWSGIDGFPPFSTWVPCKWRVSVFFFKYFAAGREEACRVPPNLCWAPRLTRQGSLHLPHGSPGSGVCLGVCFAGIWLLVGRKRVGFPQIYAGVPASCVRVPFIFHMGPLALACLWVYVLQVFRCWSGGSV